jgi:hypothetical protein
MFHKCHTVTDVLGFPALFLPSPFISEKRTGGLAPGGLRSCCIRHPQHPPLPCRRLVSEEKRLALRLAVPSTLDACRQFQRQNVMLSCGCVMHPETVTLEVQHISLDA